VLLALQSIRKHRSIRRVTTPRRTLSGLTSRSEFRPTVVARLWVSRSRYAVGLSSALRSSCDGLCRSRLKLPALPLFEFGLRPGHCPVNPSQPCRSAAGSSHGLCFPSAHRGNEGPLAAGFACPLRSALRVWLPSRRFSPFESLPALSHTGGAHGIHPSERSPFARFPSVSTRANPHTVSPSGIPAAEAPGRPDGLRFLGFNPRESPLRPSVCLARRPPDAPLGFFPPRACGRTPCSGFRRNSSHVLGDARARKTPHACTSEYRSVSASSRPQPMTGTGFG
jgi:hypothetical protein